MNSFGFKTNDNGRKRWYKFAGQSAKLSDNQRDSFEFLLFNLYGEHIKLEKDDYLNAQEIENEINEIGREAFIKKYSETK